VCALFSPELIDKYVNANNYKVRKVLALCVKGLSCQNSRKTWSCNCWDSEEIRHSQSLRRGYKIIWRGEWKCQKILLPLFDQI